MHEAPSPAEIAQLLPPPEALAEAWAWTHTKVLNDGFIVVRDAMGSEAAVLQAARVSYGAGTKTVQEDAHLLRYLLRHRHSTPFEMVELKFHVRVPMDCWRQWIRHRTANVNEYSTRYSTAIDSQQTTAPEEWRLQSDVNKQGSSGRLHDTKPATAKGYSQREAEFHKLARELYEDRIAGGIAREQARKDLPLSTYTEAYWKCDLHNLLHFVGLRMDSHAQHEIRQYATAIYEILLVLYPRIMAAWDDYHPHRHGMTLSRLEVELVKALTCESDEEPVTEEEAYSTRCSELQRAFPMEKSRERDEAIVKLKLLAVLPEEFQFIWNPNEPQ